MKNRTIWIFNHYALTPEFPGGTRHYDFSRELIKRGYEVTIFASSFHHTQLRETKDYQTANDIVENVDGVRFVWIKSYPYRRNDGKRVVNMLSYAIRAYWAGRKIIRQKPDIIIGSSVHLFAAYAAYRLSLHFKVPLLVEIRDIWPLTLVEMGIPKWHPFVIVLRALEKLLYRKAAKIITLLPESQIYFENQGIPPEKIRIIPNGVNLDKYRCDSAGQVASPNFKIMYVGKHGQSDSLHMLLAAAKALQNSGHNDIRFILIGDGIEKDALIKYSVSIDLKNVEFRPSVKKTMIPNVLGEADVFVSLMQDADIYRYGTSGNKEFDYAASGKPIIIVGNPRGHFVKESGCGLVIPSQSPEALAKAVLSLYALGVQERNNMGKRGREYVEEYFAIPLLAAKLEKVFDEVLQ